MAQFEYKPIKAFHPGDTLREKLEEMGMSVKEFAVRTSKPEKTINAVLNGDSSVTPDMAIAFEQVTLIPAHMWLNLQRTFDEYVARQKKEAIYKDEETIIWARRFPYAKIASLGWLPSTTKLQEKIDNLFSFFRITSVKAWKDYYFNQELKVAFRISLKGAKDPYAISAWLREGEILASKMTLPTSYSSSELKKNIPAMLNLVKEQPEDFSDRLRDLCSCSGIKLVYLNHIEHAPVNGCVRWVGDYPCIQMTDKQKRNDIFWFSFFHEIGHILLHGKKDIFLEDMEFRGEAPEKEKEADAYASNALLSKAAETEIIGNNDFSRDAIVKYAKKFGTHPAIILGRLQHLKKVRQDTVLNDLRVHIDLFS